MFLIEDDEDHAWLIKKYIRDAGMTKPVLHAVDLDAAKPLFRTEKFDVVLLDLNLPGCTIDETLSSMLAWAAGSPGGPCSPPSTTFNSVPERSVRARKDYLVKLEITSSILARTLRYAVERAEAQKSLHELAMRLRRAQRGTRVVFIDYRPRPSVPIRSAQVVRRNPKTRHPIHRFRRKRPRV